MLTFDRVLLMLGLFACSVGVGQVKQPNRYFVVLQATSQVWISGAPGGGKSTTYRVSIKIKTDKPIKFNSIWVAGKKLIIKLEKGGQNGELKSAKNDAVTLLATDYRGQPGKYGRKEEEKVSDAAAHPAKAPVEYEGAALMEYVVDGSAKYCAVSNITVLPTIYGQ